MNEQTLALIEDQERWHREVLPRSPEALDHALRFAAEAHGWQTRKYTNDPYIVHPMNVARLVAEVFPDIDMIEAAYLHDVVEDTHVTQADIAEHFSFRVARFVKGLTDVYTDPKVHGNRQTRKDAERVRLSQECWEVQTIKMADLCDNSCSITRYDPDFSVVYLREKARLVNNLTLARPELRELATLILEMNR